MTAICFDPVKSEVELWGMDSMFVRVQKGGVKDWEFVFDAAGVTAPEK